MTERPILFSAPMVLALLAGRKTQTRRLMKTQPSTYIPSPNRHPTIRTGPYFDSYCNGPASTANPRRMSEHWCWWAPDNRQGPDWIKCPYGIPGDVLWVKETWRPFTSLQPWDLDVRYAADGAAQTIKDGEFGERDWTMPKAAATGNVSPLFMPRWASRLTLDITDVRAERLQDISEADAEAEGVQDPSLVPILGAFWSSRDGYARLWEHINGKGSWAANPWVWAITFDLQVRA